VSVAALASHDSWLARVPTARHVVAQYRQCVPDPSASTLHPEEEVPMRNPMIRSTLLAALLTCSSVAFAATPQQAASGTSAAAVPAAPH